MKTSAGALNVLPVCREKSIGRTIRYLSDSGVKVIAAGEKAATSYTDAACNVPVALVLGAEGKGISAENQRMCDEIVKIPQFGAVGSLNVSVAAAVLMYEVVRQRRKISEQ
jgi:23S rRNA (guanosine2251-2'-O)-methyltransferase